jgi:hypothetical protein
MGLYFYASRPNYLIALPKTIVNKLFIRNYKPVQLITLFSTRDFIGLTYNIFIEIELWTVRLIEINDNLLDLTIEAHLNELCYKSHNKPIPYTILHEYTLTQDFNDIEIDRLLDDIDNKISSDPILK